MQMRDTRDFAAGRNCTKRCFFSIVLWPRRLEKSAAQDVVKICTTLWRQCGSEVKIIKTGGVGALFEIELRKFCTTLWRKSDLEVEIIIIQLKIEGFGTLFEVEGHKICTMLWRENGLREKKHHASCSEHFWKFRSAKFAPRLTIDLCMFKSEIQENK